MGFFDEYDTQVVAKTEADVACAKSLADAVRWKANRTSPISYRTWARPFALLRDRDGISQTEIEETLTWYVQHMGEHRIPKALCAKSFRDRYPYIRTAREIWLRDNPAAPPGPLATQIAKRLYRRHWPRGSKDQLPALCQQSLDRYVQWAATLRQAALPPGPAHAALLRHVRAKLTDPAYFVEEWFLAVHDAVAAWDAWSGDLRPYAFRPDHRLFQRQGREWAQRYCGRPEMWDALLEQINAG